MAKRNPYIDKMFAGTTRRIIDENAITMQDIAEWLGVSGHSISSEFAAEKIKSGEWEQVWKHGRNGLQKAYRPKKK